MIRYNCFIHVGRRAPIIDPSDPVAVMELKQHQGAAAGYTDAIYGRSNGGIAPSGWKCDHLPYLVEFDNFGGTRTPGQASQAQRPSIFVWGYDEITWFAQQPLAYRNEWLRYAWDWLKEHDSAGHLEMPGGRMLTHGPESPAEGRLNWFSRIRSPRLVLMASARRRPSKRFGRPIPANRREAC